MTDERKQSPHYIPELDPENPETGRKVKQRFLWAILIIGLIFICSGAGLYVAGIQTAGLIVAGIGIVVLAPWWILAGF